MTTQSDDPLTPQEQKVIKLVAQGEQDKQIALILNISPQTVTHYIRTSRLKLKARNKAAAAVQYYLRYEQPLQKMTQQSDQSSSIPLTDQEHRTIELVASGFNDQEIATRLGISFSTIKHHLTSIRKKLGMPNRTAAAVEYYRRLGALSYKKNSGCEGDN